MGDPDAVVMRSGDRVYAPTLSGVIEACGELGDFCLDRSQARSVGNVAWRATLQQREDRATMLQGQGSNPEEAVARLWLALSHK